MTILGVLLAGCSASPPATSFGRGEDLDAISFAEDLALAQDEAQDPQDRTGDPRAAGMPDELPPPKDVGPPTLLGNTAPGRAYDDLVAEKNDIFPLTVGAWHWFNVDLSGRDAGGYGINALPGTYFWYSRFSPKLEFEEGPIDALGAEVEFRIRDDGPFRTWFEHNWWFYEGNAYVETEVGKFQGGKILNRFGLPWDGTFYGNTPYFDGWKLDPDWGVGWSDVLAPGGGFTIETSAQFFIHDDHVNGSIAGGDAESFPKASERNTGVVRVAPKYDFDEDTSLLLGLSGTYGHVDYDSSNTTVRDQYIKAAAVDVQFRWRDLKLFGEWIHADGIRNPAHFASLGPSKRIDNYWFGGTYRWEWLTLRSAYSTGRADDPDGQQFIWVPGITVHLTKNIDFYVEYVLWDVSPAAGPRTNFEDSIQFVLNWRF